MSDSVTHNQPPQAHWCNPVLRTPVFAFRAAGRAHWCTFVLRAPVFALRALGRAHAAIGFSAPLHTRARPLLLGLLLGGLLLLYWNVVNSSVQRGEQLQRQMAYTAQPCDATATRRRPMTCNNTPAGADAWRGGPVGPKRLATR